MRGRGGFIGTNVVPAAFALNSAASGVWTVREAEGFERAGTWPIVPPGGVSAGLQLWLDASDASTLYDDTIDGSLVAADGGVARWEDKSGNARHATQGTAIRRPARKTAVQGGLGVLRFDGNATAANSDRMSIAGSQATFKFLHEGDATVFCALINGTTTNYDRILTWVDTGNLRSATGYLLAYDDRSSVSRNNTLISSGGTAVSDCYSTIINNFVEMQTAKVYTNTIQSTASAASRSLVYKNGTLDSAVNSATGTATGNASYPLFIGGTADDGGGFAFQGDFLELIIYNSALSDTNRAAVESYLMTKWGIT